jgi:hypothetical protein
MIRCIECGQPAPSEDEGLLIKSGCAQLFYVCERCIDVELPARMIARDEHAHDQRGSSFALVRMR